MSWDFTRGAGDRRQLMRSALDRWIGDLVQHTEQRVVAQRYFRPPGALPEIAFLAACTRCGECAKVCPANAIETVTASGGLAGGTPYIDPKFQPCIVCEDMPCAAACPTEALTVPEKRWEGYRMAQVELDPHRCITFEGHTCRACADACPVGETALAMDEGGHPVLKLEGCVGCGACVRACVTYPSCFTLTLAES